LDQGTRGGGTPPTDAQVIAVTILDFAGMAIAAFAETLVKKLKTERR